MQSSVFLGGKMMDNKDKKKLEPWRIVVGVLAVACIVYMWVKKDILAIYAAMRREQALPLVVTTLSVSMLKVAAIAGGILLIKWLVDKFKK